MNVHIRSQLRQQMMQMFDVSKLRNVICFDLGIDPDDLVSEKSNKNDLIAELIKHCERHNKLTNLIEKCEKECPHNSWPQISAYEESENIELIPPKLTKNPEITFATIPSESTIEQENRSSEVLERTTFSEPASNWEKIQGLTEKVIQAEKDSDHAAIAELYAELAELLKQEKRYVRARDYARKSADYFLKIDKKENAVQQRLFAAEIWMNYTAFADTMADRDLENAQKIASGIDNFTLRAQVFLLQAQYSMLLGTKHSTEKMWEQVETSLLKIRPDHQIEVSTELAIQKAMVARLEEEWATVKKLLEDANSRDWPPQSKPKHLELLWCLLFFYAESGEWKEVDRIYEIAQKLLADQNEFQKARWLMHYAASLARRGNANGAYETYLVALGFFNSNKATALQKHHFFQDMLYSLIQHAGHEVFSSAMKHDLERLDLALNVLHEDVGHLHLERARRDYFDGNTDRAFSHIEYALMHAWRKGDWSGLSEAKKARASLYHAKQDYVSAIFTAIGVVPGKVIEKYSLHLNDLNDPDEIRQIIDNLLQIWPTRADLEDALVTLAQCTDIVPFNRLEQVIQYTLNTLKEYIGVESATNTCRPAIKVLRLLSPRFDSTQTQVMIRFSIEILNTPLRWFIKSEFIQLLGTCFDNGSNIQSDLYHQAMDVTLTYYGTNDSLQTEVEVTLLYIAMNAPSEVRKRISAFFRERSEWDYLAILKEPIPEEALEQHIKNILYAITPHRQEGSIGYSGRRARSINNFNEYITSSIGNFLVEGLLNAIRNQEGFLTQKSDAILTLRWLPESILKEHANKISPFLLEVANGKYVDTEVEDFLNWFGDEENVRRNSLYTLGRLYTLVNDSLKKQIHDSILTLSRSNSATIRMGAAMALRTLEGSYKFSIELTFTLIELLQDEDPQVRHWAASAAGHRIADKKVLKSASEFIIRRLLTAATEEVKVHARAGIAYGLRILEESGDLEKSLKDQVQQARGRLLNDVNYQVVRLASGPK